MAVAVVLTVAHRDRLRLPGAHPAPDQCAGHEGRGGPAGGGAQRAQRRPYRHRGITRPRPTSRSRRPGARTGPTAVNSALGSTPISRRRMLRKASYCRRAATQSPAAWCASMSARWPLSRSGSASTATCIASTAAAGRPACAQQPAQRLQGVQQRSCSRSRDGQAPSRRTSRGAVPGRRSDRDRRRGPPGRRVRTAPGRPMPPGWARSTSTSSRRPSQDCSASHQRAADLLQPPQRRAQVAGRPAVLDVRPEHPRRRPAGPRRPRCRAR